MNDLGSALDIYQQILLDGMMRQSPVSDPETSAAMHADRMAKEAIARIIATPAGAEAYKVYEQRASSALAMAKTSGSTEQLLIVAAMYPNAAEAREALQAAADVFEIGENPRQATTVLREVLSETLEPDRRRGLLEAMGRNYLKVPGRLDIAAARRRKRQRLDLPSR